MKMIERELLALQKRYRIGLDEDENKAEEIEAENKMREKRLAAAQAAARATKIGCALPRSQFNLLDPKQKIEFSRSSGKIAG